VRAVAELGAGAGRGAPRWRALAGLGVLGWRLPRRWGPRALGPRTRGFARRPGGPLSPSPSPRPPAGGAQPRRRRPTPHVCTRGAPPRRLVAAPHHRVWCGVLGRWRGTHARRVVTDHERWAPRRARDQPRGWCRARRPVPARVPWRRRPELHTVGARRPRSSPPFPRYHRDLGAVIWCPPRRPVWRAAMAATALLEGLCDRGALYTGAALPALPTGSSP